MLTCQQIAEFLMDYLDGALPVMQRVKFEFHLAMCRSCRNYLKAYSDTIQAGKAAFQDSEAATAIPEELVRAILASRTPDDDASCG